MAEDLKDAPKSATEGSVAVPDKKKGNKKLFMILGAVFFVLFVLPGIILILALTWFSRGDHAKKAAETLIEKSTGSQVDVNNGNYTVKGKDGTEVSVGSSQKYADDFPSDVPKYPGGDVKSAVRTSSNGTTYWSNSVETTDAPDKVSAFFTDKFSTWTNEGEFSYNDSRSVSYKKGDLSVALTISKSDPKTSITYGVTKETKTTP